MIRAAPQPPDHRMTQQHHCCDVQIDLRPQSGGIGCRHSAVIADAGIVDQQVGFLIQRIDGREQPRTAFIRCDVACAHRHGQRWIDSQSLGLHRLQRIGSPRCQHQRPRARRKLTRKLRAQSRRRARDDGSASVEVKAGFHAGEACLSADKLPSISSAAMTINQLSDQQPFTTKDGSTIRSILDRTNAPVQNQSLAEASVATGGSTQRHYHKLAEEFYFILEGTGIMEIDGETRAVGPGDAILIPRGAWHQITAAQTLRFLCCCAPPYSHEDTYFQ